MQLPKLHGGNPSVRRADQAERMRPLSPQGGIAASCLVDNEKPRFFSCFYAEFREKSVCDGWSHAACNLKTCQQVYCCRSGRHHCSGLVGWLHPTLNDVSSC